ncbi:tetratricopeptide repeat protein, partial [Vibrio parahaemolyticus]
TAADPIFAKALKALHAKNYAKAQRLFRDCVEADRTWFAAWCNLGAALFDAGRYEDALKPLEIARQLAPDSGPVHFNLAQALLMLGRW